MFGVKKDVRIVKKYFVPVPCKRRCWFFFPGKDVIMCCIVPAVEEICVHIKCSG